MKKMICAALLFFFWTVTAGAETVARFGVITDVHHTNKPDTAERKYSAAPAKTAYFVKTMHREKADFIIELGDFIDKVVKHKDPLENLNEVESVFSAFKGPRYHVLGNHEFADIERDVLVPLLFNTEVPPGKTYYSFDRNGIHGIVLDADYTAADPHRPYDLQNPDHPFWNWKESWIPQKELEWLASDLASSNLPTVVFTHQVLHRDTTGDDYTIRNADVVRGLLEADGQVLAVFSGHDHRGEIAFRGGIHYFVLEGNVGMSRDWSKVSPTNGLDPIKDAPFILVEIKEKRNAFRGVQMYEIILRGHAQQYTFMDQALSAAP